jgi:type VI protein secretion system component Hcp
MAIYMKASDLTGSVTAQGFEQCIALEDVEFLGIHTDIHTEIGSAKSRVQSMPNFGRVLIVKRIDKSSTDLF